jgi:anti-anti-sigma regulatory factor
MKVSLRQEDSASILEIQGSIDSHNFAVLKAGLTRLLQNGKNRIVLHLQSPAGLSSDVLREIAILDVFARELSGKLVIASDNIELKKKVESFAKPPLVAFLPSVAKALEYLKDLDALEGDEGGENLVELQKELEMEKAARASLEARLKLADTSVAQKIRAENAMMKDRVKFLEGQLQELLGGERKQPSEAVGYLEKIQVLEATVKRLGGDKISGERK